MKPLTEAIHNWLNYAAFLKQLEQFKNNNPGLQHYETTIEEAISRFNRDRETLLESIHNGMWDESVPYQKRVVVHQALQTLVNHMGNMESYGFQASHPQAGTLAQGIISTLNQFEVAVENARLYERANGLHDYSSQLIEIQKIKEEFYSLVKEIQNAKLLNEESTLISQNVKTIGSELSTKLADLEQERLNTLLIRDELNAANKQITAINQDTENKHVKINAFYSNIKEYEATNEKLQGDAKALLAKEFKINELIDQAEKALNLKSAEGISAAFSAHYNETSEKKFLGTG